MTLVPAVMALFGQDLVAAGWLRWLPNVDIEGENLVADEAAEAHGGEPVKAGSA